MTNAQLTMSWGLHYLNLGWSIIPVRPKGKLPLIEWKEFQNRRVIEAELKNWINAWPNMNIGVVTGKISQLIIVDLDGLEGKKFGSTTRLVSSVTQMTGNGIQVFYKWTEPIGNSVKKIAPGVDIRGDGGFVVVPPSIHPSGKMYRWERFVPAHIPCFPRAILAVTNTVQSLKDNTADGNKQEAWIKQALEDMSNGHVHNNLVSVLGRFRHHNFSVDDTVALLKPYAEKGGMLVEELKSKTKEIWRRYEPKISGLTSLYSGASENQRVSIKSPTNDNDFEQYTTSLVKSEHVDSLRTGFKTLDRYTEGNFKSERLFTVAARTGTGKTNFAIALARNLCEQGKKVLFFSTEFSYTKIWTRYISTITITNNKLQQSQFDRFREHAFYVCDSFSPNLSQVEEALKEVIPDVFIFDHINHIGEDREGLGAFMQGCNFLQRKYACQGVMVAQLNRQADWVEDGKRIEPRMSMIKGSGTIEQASSRVLLLSETRVTPEMCEILGVLDKNDSGERGLINFALLKNPFKFVELI